MLELSYFHLVLWLVHSCMRRKNRNIRLSVFLVYLLMSICASASKPDYMGCCVWEEVGVLYMRWTQLSQVKTLGNLSASNINENLLGSNFISVHMPWNDREIIKKTWISIFWWHSLCCRCHLCFINYTPVYYSQAMGLESRILECCLGHLQDGRKKINT